MSRDALHIIFPTTAGVLIAQLVLGDRLTPRAVLVALSGGVVAALLLVVGGLVLRQLDRHRRGH